MPVATLENVSLAYGHVPLLDRVQLVIEPGDKIALIGRNGTGKSSLLRVLAGEAPAEALKLGWAHGALLTTFPGDTTMATVEQVRSFAQGGSARIQR